MLAEQVVENQLTNDLSNASTPGYKADESSQGSFGQLLLKNISSGQPIGSLATGVQIDRTVTDLAPALAADDQPAAGLRRSPAPASSASRPRRGSATPATASSAPRANGNLVDQNGNTVLGQGGAPIAGRRGRNRPGERARRVQRRRARPSRATTSSPAPPPGRATGVVQSGKLEQSGVDPAQTMVNMIAALQSYDAGQKALQTFDRRCSAAPARSDRSVAPSGDRGGRLAAAGGPRPGHGREPSAAPQVRARPPITGLTRSRSPQAGPHAAEAGLPGHRERSWLKGCFRPRQGWPHSSSASTRSATTSRTSTPTATRPSASASRTCSTARPAAPSGATVATGAGAALTTIGTSQAQGAIQQTGRTLDVALNGPGYLEIRQSNGSVGLTRNGALALDASGQLTTADGSLVQPPITVPARRPRERDRDRRRRHGRRRNGKALGKLAIVTRARPRSAVGERQQHVHPDGGQRRGARR